MQVPFSFDNVLLQQHPTDLSVESIDIHHFGNFHPLIYFGSFLENSVDSVNYLCKQNIINFPLNKVLDNIDDFRFLAELHETLDSPEYWKFIGVVVSKETPKTLLEYVSGEFNPGFLYVEGFANTVDYQNFCIDLACMFENTNIITSEVSSPSVYEMHTTQPGAPYGNFGCIIDSGKPYDVSSGFYTKNIYHKFLNDNSAPKEEQELFRSVATPNLICKILHELDTAKAVALGADFVTLHDNVTKWVLSLKQLKRFIESFNTQLKKDMLFTDSKDLHELRGNNECYKLFLQR